MWSLIKLIFPDDCHWIIALFRIHGFCIKIGAEADGVGVEVQGVIATSPQNIILNMTRWR